MESAHATASLSGSGLGGSRAGVTPAHGVVRQLLAWWSVGVLALLLLALPLVLDPFRLGLAAKYLCLSFAAVGIVLIWGYGGILSLGQGMFFGLGS